MKGISLSSTWFNRTDKAIFKSVKNNIVNYFRNIVKGKSDENMWTTYIHSRVGVPAGACRAVTTCKMMISVQSCEPFILAAIKHVHDLTVFTEDIF